MKILVTSSTGLTGKAVVSSLSTKGAYVRAMIHSDRRKEEMLRAGASETVISSIEDEDSLRVALMGMDAVFYICPTAHPEEGKIGEMAVRLAQECGIDKFIYQSVHNSIEPELPHHRQKLMVEQCLLESSMNYIILRPSAFMQNLLPSIIKGMDGYVINQRFYKSIDAKNRINLIDVDDYAEIASKVSFGMEYAFSKFDLCGPENLSAIDMIESVQTAIRQKIELCYIPDEQFITMAHANGMQKSKIQTLITMFKSYNEHGFKGNPYIATALLGHTPKDFSSFLLENVKSK